MRTKAPDVTGTEAGRELVDIMAHGVLAYMRTEGIPATPQGYAEVVARSRESGLNGKIAFIDREAKIRIMELIGRHTGMAGFLVSSTSPDGGDISQSISDRLRKAHLMPGDTTIPEEMKTHLLQRLREVVGDELYPIIEASRLGDCQRELVWKRIEEIIQSDSSA